MNDEQRRIIIRRISGYDQQGTNSQDRVPRSPINRWLALAIMIPVLALMAVLGVFFFTIFVALFTIIAVVVGVRIWWLRRKFQRAMQEAGEEQSGRTAQSSQSTQSGIVEDAEIIEETTVTRERKKS